MALSRRPLWCALAVCLALLLRLGSAIAPVSPPHSQHALQAQPADQIKSPVSRRCRYELSAVDKTFLLLALLRAAPQGFQANRGPS